MKEVVWRALVMLFRCIPGSILQQICALAFHSRVGRRDAKNGLIELLEMESRLHWFLDQQAIKYGDGIHPKHRLTDYHRFFIERVNAGDRVLDIGCGYGALAFSIALQGAKVTGVDLNATNIEKAKTKCNDQNISYMVGDITRQLPSGPFDIIVMSNVLEHIELRTQLLQALVAEYLPCKFLIRVPMSNRHWYVPMRLELGLPHFSDPTHCVEYTLDSFLDEMNQAYMETVSHTIIWGEIWAVVVPKGIEAEK